MKQVACFLLSGVLAAQSQQRLTDQRIVELVAMGVSEPEILRIIQSAPHFDFDLRPPSTDAMLRAGVSEDIMKAMAAREAGEVSKSQLPPPSVNAGPLQLPSRPPAAADPSSPAPEPGTPENQDGFARFDQPPRPIFAPLPELPPGPKPFAVSIQAIPESPASAYSLSDEEVQQVIKDGLSSARPLGLTLHDAQSSLSGASAGCATCVRSGDPITIYTREEWIALAARNAKRQLLAFSAADVPPAIRMPLLYVSTSPSASGSRTSPVSPGPRIMMRDGSGHSSIQPIELPNGGIESNNTFKLASAGAFAEAFQISDVNALRASDAKGDLFIVVSDAGENRHFKLKSEEVRALGSSFGSQPLSGAPPAATP